MASDDDTIDTTDFGSSLPFEPNPFQRHQMPLFDRNKIPRYLFRLYSSKSDGQTTDEQVIPPASLQFRSRFQKDIFQIDPSDAAPLLNNHLRWRKGHESNCNLMSWSSSLLFVLQYGLHKYHLEGKKDKSYFNKISLLVTDTEGVKPGTFVQDLEIMEIFAQHDHKSEVDPKNLANLLALRQGKQGYYFGEFLSQGKVKIKGRCIVTSLEKLISIGLFDLRPELSNSDTWQEWAKQVLNLRKVYTLEEDPSVANQVEVKIAISIAKKCFGGKWTFPMALMLLALQLRVRNDRVILEEFAAQYSYEMVENLGLTTLDGNVDGLPELEQYEKLSVDVIAQLRGDRTDVLINRFEQLALDVA